MVEFVIMSTITNNNCVYVLLSLLGLTREINARENVKKV